MKSLSRPIWIVLLAVLLAPSAGCGDRRSDEQRLQDALANIEKRDYRAAVIDLKNILRGQPDNLPARLALGDATFQLGDAAGAEKEYNKARELGAEADAFAAPLARAMMQNRAYREMIAELDPAALSDSAQADVVRAYRGMALLEIGSSEDAEAVFDELSGRETSPEAMRLALVGKAKLAGRSGDVSAAEKLVRESLDFVPGSADSTLVLGQLLLRQGEFAKAEEVFTYGRNELGGTVIEHFMLGAGEIEALLGQNKNQQATDNATKLVEGGPGHPVGRFMLARALRQNGEPAEAAEQLRQLLSKYPGYTPAQVLLGALSLELGDLEQAEMVLAPVVSDNPANSTARRLLAETRMRLNRPDEAADTLRGGNVDDPRSLNMLARAEASRGEQGNAIELLEQSLAKAPDNLQTKLALIAAYVADGQAERAIAVINGLPEGVISPQRREAMLVVAGIDRDKIADSVTQLDELVARWPDDGAILSVAGGMFVAGGLNDKARALFERLHEMAPDDIGVLTNLARLDGRSGNYDRSRTLFESYLSRHPNDIQPMLALARIAEQEGDRAAANRYVEQANKADPDALAPNLLLANIELGRGDIEAARRYADAALKGNPGSAAAHAAMGMTEMRSGNHQAALEKFRKAADLQPTNSMFHYYKGVAEVQLGMVTPARETLANVLKLDDDDLRARRALLILDAKAGDMERAENHLAVLQQRQPNAPDTLEAEGDLRVEQRRAEEAAAAYDKATALRPSQRLAQRNYELRKSAGLPQPLAPLKTWLAGNPDDRAMRLLYAQELQSGGLLPAAIEQYEAILEQEPNNPLAMNNLAWLYLEQPGDASHSRALELARQAHEALPRNTQIADTYGWVLFKAGQEDAARDVLESALGNDVPASQPDIAYHLAAVLQQAGDKNGARRLLNEALKSGQPFYSEADAQALLDSL